MHTLYQYFTSLGVPTDDAGVAMETAAGVNGTEPAPQEDGEKEEDLPPLSAAEIFARRQKKVQEKKRTIAMLSSALIENPEQNASNDFICAWKDCEFVLELLSIYIYIYV